MYVSIVGLVMLGRRTCDPQVASSIPGRALHARLVYLINWMGG